MDSKYDRKFEEMKQYIPFLENMINRLESGPASANPRQAQLDKIRSLRDLLIDKKKRMKMENLLKCEQVLVNLYAKVEQRDTLPGVGKSSDPLFPSHNTEAKADLNSVRHKLKKVASITKIEEQDPDTLPEIARASETEEVCTPGSKEPALFQRRPNKSSKSPSSATRSDTKSPLGSASKRNYTRVLVSPDKTSQRWNTPEKPTPEKPLFSRRSPRRSPPRNSTALYPPHYKKDRKKSSNQTAKHQPKDFNITLNVPEESLNSLNTEDIVNRIMDCSDNDVDISTLRDLRSQIIGELKKTGGSGGLSNLIMKSYKKKKKKNRKNPQKTEVEEGELSDSESEAIESVYGSLVLVDKIKNSPSEVKAVTTRKEEQPRKIQICFVINSDKEGTSEVGIKDSPAVIDVPELEMFETEKAKTAETKTTKTVEPKDTPKENQVLLKGDKVEISSQVTDKLPNTGKPNNQSQIQSQDVITIDDEDDAAINKTIPIATNEEESAINNDTSNNKSGNSEFETVSNNKSDVIPREATEPVAFKANFYKPINDHEIEETNVLSSEVNKVEKLHIDTNNPPTETNADEHEEKRCVESDKQVEAADVSTNNLKAKENVVHDTRENVEIPLLNLEPVVPAPLPKTKQVVSEIDILQALKNEILNEPIAIPGTETATPALHQPKITKVASAQEILKKRISIEKYKEKSVTPSKTPSLVVKKSRSYLSKEDYFKRQSLKLTEKECERFNFPAKLAIDDSSDDEELSLDDVYGDLAPRSPENEDLGETSVTPPIIIPADSVKTSVISSKLDVDMRQMMPMSSPNSSKHASSLYANAVPVTTNNNDALPETIRTESKPEQNYIPPLLSLDVYPRLKWDVNMPINKESPNPHKNPERTPISALNYPNMTPNRTPSMTPSRTPSMTPNARTFEMTPSRQSLEVEDNTNRKHVYAPLLPLPMYDSRENREISVNRDTHRPHWEPNSEIKSDGRRSTDGNNSRKWEDRDPRSASIQRENSSDYQKSRYNESDRYGYDKRDDYSYSRLDCPRTPVHSFGRSDCPNTPTPSFGRMDTPMTPNHPFGRSECPTTPSHPFGRSECPSTPSHPFGRSECPSTPSHPFGRSECPTTPSHSFGRSECPPTPTHSFGRSECPLTPSHQFGRSECPSTPSHPFGRSEGPMTPSHPFGNSDKAPMTPSHQFGRSDYSQNSLNTGAKFGKDPRLNRATDYESTSRNYDKDRYYKDVPKRSYTNPDPYRNYSREQSIGRNDRSFEKSGRPYGRDQVSHSDGRTPREPEQLYTRERANHNNDYQQEFRSSRAPSLGRNYQEGAEKTLSVKPQSGRSFTIDTSVNRTFQEFLNEKGIQIFDYSPANTFDARRQRATSVGRSLVRTPSVGRTIRESSVGRTLSKPQPTRNDSDLRNRNNFVRARSMGREVADNKQEKSFKDIKADFKTYSANYKKQDIKVAATEPRKMNYRDPRTRKLLKEMQEKKKSYQSDTKPVYSPRKNNRDPRLRREEHSDGNRYRAEDKSRERKSYGIVYSNDNIARGTILGSGYGVRNYKIPKIKRAIEEKQHIEKVEQNEKDNKSKVKGTKLVKSSDTDKTKNNSIERNTADPSGVSKKGKKHSKDEKSKTSEKYDTKKSTPMHSAKKTTRQLSPDLSKSKLCEDKVTRKSKRAVISDSDSDSHKEEKIVDKSRNKNEAAVPLLTKSGQTDKEEDDILDNSFGIDDLEIFPENMVSDPVMDNINALIAHLDNDISDSKIDNSGQFTKEISLENMLDNITSPEGDSTVDESLNDLNELINEDLNQVKTQSYEKSPMLTSEQTKVDNFAMIRELKKPSENGDFKSDESGQILVGKDVINQGEPIHTNEKVQAVLNDSPKLPMSNKISSIEEHADKQKASEPGLSTEDRSTNFEGISLSSNVSHSLNEMKSESLVSTTDKTEKHLLDKVENKSAEKQTIENRADRLSTPDSTINIDETKESKLCDSTNELHSDITSIHDPAEISKIKSIEKTDKEVDPQIQSIGSLLSILQDKTKIKELLGMLSGNSVENEKIKKNLEKLSEIVSDDENDNDTSVGQKVIPTEPNVESDDKNKLGDKPIDKIETEDKVEKKEVRSESADKLEKNDKTDLNKVGAESFDELQVKEKSDLNEIIAESSDKQDANGTIAVNEIRRDSSHKLEVMEKADINEIEAELSNKGDANDQIEKKDARKESAENLEANNKTDLSIVGVKTSDKLEVNNKTDENDGRTGLTDKLEVKKKAGAGEGSVKSSDKTEVTDSNEPYPDGLDEDTSSELSTKPKKSKKRSGKRRNRKWRKNALSGKEKRVTRSEAAGLQTNKPKKASRELKLLHDDIKEMFISDDILNATGIRMCRLAKLVDDKTSNQDEETITATGSKPVVVLEKFKDKNDMLDGKPLPEKPIRKKTGPKPKIKPSTSHTSDDLGNLVDTPKLTKNKPGPKSKTKPLNQVTTDPYAFESDSVSEKKVGDALVTSSDSESDSLASSVSLGSSEALTELKKKIKRKRGSAWQSGVIKPKKKKKVESKATSLTDSSPNKNATTSPNSPSTVTVPDLNSFTDKSYCFVKNVYSYPCRLCHYTGNSIVHHYKKHHPHSEIPLSRMEPSLAREAIVQCEEINFQTISKVTTDKYVCRFCLKEFSKRKINILETFFWHVVSTHTGEYKQLCSECINVTRCPFNLDIPPPPKDVKGQLMGYICGKCNFTQISLENLKTHVIVRHNDEQTEVYTINLAIMSKKAINALMKQSAQIEKPRVLRSSRSNQSMTDMSDDRSENTEGTDRLSEFDSAKPSIASQSLPDDVPKGQLQSRLALTFENDDNTNIPNTVNDASSDIKKETDNEAETHTDQPIPEPDIPETTNNDNTEPPELEVDASVSSDHILTCPHFKINYTDAGTKEYECCINGTENHYKTNLLISMKKHIQTKHSEKWDGYCFFCKVIVTPGQHSFKDCLQHILDKHLDNFPIERAVVSEPVEKISEVTPIEKPRSPKNYINVRPLSELLFKENETAPEESDESLPKIQSVVSLGDRTAEAPIPSPTPPAPEIPIIQENVALPNLPIRKQASTPKEPRKYEEAQAEVMTKKHQVVLNTMISDDKLVKIFKCAGRFCYFTSDNIEDALLHASTHQRIGGENAMHCAYCDFEFPGNAIALVMHVFKEHGRCQYSCSRCFYRAAAGQLVRAHMIRVHGELCEADVVLKTLTVTPGAEDSVELLPRETAVQYYVCADDPNCKFRTYPQGKFSDHLLKHTPPHSCHICSTVAPTPNDLIAHMKSHDMKVYQCTWCVHGADNEPELLAHASARHPNRQPQAYLRVITSKDGTTKKMVLPLAQFNKSVVKTRVVSPTASENPVREAERSIELETLIGSMITISDPQPIDTQPEDMPEGHDQELIVPGEMTPIESLLPIPRLVTPPPSTSAENNLPVQLLPVLKIEPNEETPTKKPSDSIVICLDSDEEDSTNSAKVIDLSDDESHPIVKETVPVDLTTQKIPLTDLFKCPKCKNKYKTLPAFKRHYQACCPNIKDGINCPHCPKTFTARSDLYNHYEKDHRHTRDIPPREAKSKDPNAYQSLNSDQSAVCAICNLTHRSVTFIKCHLKTEHGITNFDVTSKYADDGKYVYTVRESEKAKQIPKRKLSAGNSESPTKRRRFGPHDIDQLPTKPILDDHVFCSLCEFSSKVRLNIVRHLQGHADKQPVAHTVPVNPVPHLESNEKHFDKMVNLASSSIVNRTPDKPPKEPVPTVSLVLSPEEADRYPKFVPERQRYTCGYIGCSYTSVDETMLKCHWETLHEGSSNFLCTHCPPHQQLNTAQALTSTRIISHLKMHDVCLYACSSCSTYYHHRRYVAEKHITEVHKGVGQVMVVREEANPLGTGPSQPAPTAAPSMDLKPWQCGLCKFKSMLRQEVVEHCSKIHCSKMQFKCPNCPFRTSTLDNVRKHQSNSHPKSTDVVIHYYYQEGSIHDEGGTPRWMVQRQKMGHLEPEVKAEVDAPTPSASQPPILIQIQAAGGVDLNIVKKEVEDQPEETLEDLCKRFGQFCEPNGLKFKCPLCKIVMEDTKDAMQSHLFEELKYRKWSCSICTYKAFHKTGLYEHMAMEHRQNRDPIELPKDVKVERWVMELLAHQTKLIAKTKENFAKQKIPLEKPRLFATASVPKPVETSVSEPPKTEELITNFGEYGASYESQFACPKCDFKIKEESAMKDHLETELNRIRWRCSNCSAKFQEYHEAQLHCKSIHPGRSARPVEALRDATKRAAWVEAVIRSQKLGMPLEAVTQSAYTNPVENSLLVVRYEQRVPTPEEDMLMRRKRPAPTPPNIPATPATTPDSDDERLVIDEPTHNPQDAKKILNGKKCSYCDFTSKYSATVRDHEYRHFNLQPNTCTHCGYSCFTPRIGMHNETMHPHLPSGFVRTKLPDGPPLTLTLANKGRRPLASSVEEVTCLVCEITLRKSFMSKHTHDKLSAVFGKKGELVVKCCNCLALLPNVTAVEEHHHASHSNAKLNYAFHRLGYDTREIHCCGYCAKRFKFIRDLRSHHNAVHSSLPFKFAMKPFSPACYDVVDVDEGMSGKRTLEDPLAPTPKRVAKKSTTKLPKLSVARKSTTKLPLYFYAESESESDEEYSYYSSKPTPLKEYENVTARMPFCNTVMSFTLKKLSEIIKLSPQVVVKDINK